MAKMATTTTSVMIYKTQKTWKFKQRAFIMSLRQAEVTIRTAKILIHSEIRGT